MALEHLLDKYHDMETSEIWDRVYGFLGLLETIPSEDGYTPLIVDYSMPVAHVFAAVNRHLQAGCRLPDIKARLSLIESLSDVLAVSPVNATVLAAKSEAESTIEYQKLKVAPTSYLRAMDTYNQWLESPKFWPRIIAQPRSKNPAVQRPEAFWSILESALKPTMKNFDKVSG